MLNNGGDDTMGFMNSVEMADFFSDKFKKGERKVDLAQLKEMKEIAFAHWYFDSHEIDRKLEMDKIMYSHHEGITGGSLKCDTATDEWYKWFLQTPGSQHPMLNPASQGTYGGTGAHFFRRGDSNVYFATASPFQEPHDFRRITMTQKAALLVPAYNVIASKDMYPEASDDICIEMVKEDLCQIKPDTVSAKLDDKAIYGCSVVRDTPLAVANIPKDNIIGIPEDRLNQSGSVIHIYHGGFWLEVRMDNQPRGDHLLTFSVKSNNYEISVKMLVTLLF